MRWKAANALTASLSATERQELLQRLDVNSSTVGNTTNNNKNQSEGSVVAVAADAEEQQQLEMKNSIAEAVAAARAQESRLNAEKWEREKAKLLQEAEQAAVARMESDLAIQKRRIAFEKWKEQVESEKMILTATAAATTTTTTVDANEHTAGGNSISLSSISSEDDVSMTQLPVTLAVADDETTTTTTEATTAAAKLKEIMDEPHPILGPCLLDLGYKRVHVVSAQALAAIPVWKKQRIYRHDRAKAMAVDKQKTMHLGMPGVIGLHEDQQGKLSILDGQHRVGMFSILATNKQNGTDGMLDRILIEVYPQQEHHDDSHAQDIFLEVNKAEPVKLVDMPGVAKGSDRKMLTEAAERLYEQYSEMFRPSQKCRPPHLNLDNFRDALFAANVIARHNIKTSKQLKEWIKEQNERLAVKYKPGAQQDEQARSMVAATSLEKAIKFHFYLGLESSWYYN